MKTLNKSFWKSWLPYLVAVVVFILIAMVYCSPILDGKVLYAGDALSGAGMGHDINEYYQETGNRSFWTNAMFSGMPTYQINNNLPSLSWLNPISKIYHLGLPLAMAVVFIYLMGFFILLRSFKINKWLSIVGAIAITFSSYFFIIIGAGHINKVYGLAYLAPVIAGFMLMFRKEYIWGISLTLLFSAIGLMVHPQMTYYMAMLLGIFFFTELFIHIKEKRMKDFIVATLLFVACIGVGVGTSYGKLQSNREYVKETMRGGHSELVKATDSQNKTEGLDLDYATQWSYGIDETMTLLIPNFKGGSSNYNVGTDSKIFNELKDNGVPRKEAENFCKNVPAYWGTQPFTAGPVYVGAIIFFLFVLGLLIVKGPYKWAILIATIFSILLSWGKNFMPFTELFFNYFPMYDKFRAVASILVVAEVTIPLLGFLSLKAIMDKEISKERILKNLYISGGITAGICLIFALFGGIMYNFVSPNDAQFTSQIPDWVYDGILAERASMLRNDAWRSFFFILLAGGLVWFYVKEKMKFGYFVAGMGVLILADMWTVDKRFFNDDNFATERNYKSYFKKQPYEEYILQDKDPHFRVLNLTTNTFNESRTSYYLKSIGGYHAAKLRRYQDLIDEHISKMNMGVINMLNTKYVITKGNNDELIPQQNPGAMGNAWFVDSLVMVNTPNEESDALKTINLTNTAVLDKKFAGFTKDFVAGNDSTASVKLLTYAPDMITYQSTASRPGTVVFSEIYYPYGWKAYIDDKPVDHFRANYTLRALNVPSGTHQIRFEFRPDSIYKGEKVSFLFIFIMYGTIIGLITYSIVRKRKEQKA